MSCAESKRVNMFAANKFCLRVLFSHFYISFETLRFHSKILLLFTLSSSKKKLFKRQLQIYGIFLQNIIIPLSGILLQAISKWKSTKFVSKMFVTHIVRIIPPPKD